MRNEHGEELESGDELMVSAEGRVIVASVQHAAIIEILQPREGDRGADHVLEETLELRWLAPGNAAIA